MSAPGPICPVCHGIGQVRAHSGDADVVTCDGCGGDGTADPLVPGARVRVARATGTPERRRVGQLGTVTGSSPHRGDDALVPCNVAGDEVFLRRDALDVVPDGGGDA